MCFTLYVFSIPEIPNVPEEERTPVVVELLEICHRLRELVQGLRDEIAELKGHKPKPKIRPSRLEQDCGSKEEEQGKSTGKRAGSAKRRKTGKLTIHETTVVKLDSLPAGSRFRGYEDFTVQELVIGAHNTRYRRERWLTPAGDSVVAKLPAEAGGGHFGPTLVAYILEQYYHAHVTQPLLLEELLELGFDLSAGQLSRIITADKEDFHAEKAEILRAGLAVSRYVHVDDTGARHQGRNGYCTHIGNELFAWFESTASKSRINFLKLLRAGHTDYVLNDDALQYMRAQRLAELQLKKLVAHGKKTLSDEARWAATLEGLEITDARHVRIATEGGLLGSVLDHGVNPALVIMSDDAGQFDVLLHVLCWIHAERTINKLVGFNDKQREAVAEMRTKIWDLYDDLKAYKQTPSEDKRAKLEARFDEIFTTQTCYVSLNLALKRLYRNKSELLLVLEHPEIPLHNNLSERDIREYVKKRKISGSTRSELGRRCRDTFTSLKKTCRKLGVSFWEYLQDRVCGRNAIPPLPELIRRRAQESTR